VKSTKAGPTGESEAASAKLVGGDPCLDFVNTVGGRVPGAPGTRSRVLRDKLGSYGDLLAWARHADVVDDRIARGLSRCAAREAAPASRVHARALAGREALHSVLTALVEGRTPPAAELAAVNTEVRAARQHERLVPTPVGLRWEYADADSRLESVLWPVWRAAARLLASEDVSHVRRCGGEDCGWLFLDHSRNHTRRWCTMEDCGNLSKVRRFRERRRQET